MLTREDLAAYAVIDREPVRVAYRGREVLTNPPPSAGGILIARALALLDVTPAAAAVDEIVDVMERTQASAPRSSWRGSTIPGSCERFLAGRGPLGLDDAHRGARPRRLGVLGHLLHRLGSGVIVPGTGVHLNNMLGEQDLNPLGFHRHPPGRRLPSMMAPTVVLRDGAPELALGSAGSNRIRSAILQTIVRVDRRGTARRRRRSRRRGSTSRTGSSTPSRASTSPRWSRPAARSRRSASATCSSAAPRRSSAAPTARFSGGGDPRRGGAAMVVEAP